MQASEHASETAVQVATKKRSNHRREAQKLIAGMIKDRKGAAKNPVIAPTGKKATMAASGHGQPSKPENGRVYVRHMRKPRNAWILIKNTGVFGAVSNWATKEEFRTAEAAVAWARKNGLKVAGA